MIHPRSSSATSMRGTGAPISAAIRAERRSAEVRSRWSPGRTRCRSVVVVPGRASQLETPAGFRCRAWRVETPGIRCPGCYLGRSTRPRNPRLTAHSDLALASVGLVQRRQYTGTRCENGHDEYLVLDFRDTAGVERRVAQHARDAGSAAAPTMRQPKPKHNSGVGAKSKGTR
jgi:hypothetical protein